MKAESWIFGITALFVAVVAPAYWFLTEDWTGTSALVSIDKARSLISFEPEYSVECLGQP